MTKELLFPQEWKPDISASEVRVVCLSCKARANHAYGPVSSPEGLSWLRETPAF